jgi:lysine 6-dehydrogenase
MKIIILGAGLVGGPMAIDLAKDDEFDVTAVDIDESALKRLGGTNAKIATTRADLSDPAVVSTLVADHDLALSAVPGFMGFRTVQAIIETGKSVVDIAFFPENPFDLDELAKEKGVTAIVDCGVAPGMSNMLVGHVDRLLDRTDDVLIYVGGLPQVREWPYEYKAVFSPIDVIEEYLRPARYVENGRLVVREALSDAELIDFPGVGTLEAFNTDGLRTIANTIDAPNMKEKTLRYEGHIEKMAVLRATGLFDQREIEINGTKIRPIDFTAKLLFPIWELKPGDADITVMRVIVEGEKDGRKVRYDYDLLDRYDTQTGTHSMARTTGYAATMAIRMLAAGLYERGGVSPPEFVGRDEECVAFMLKGLEERGVVYRRRIEEL